MKTRRLMIMITLFAFIFLSSGQALAEVNVSANNAVLIEQSTGRVLFEKKAHEKQSIASITKIMTAIIAIEQGNLDDIVTVSKRAVWAEGSSIYLIQDEQITLKDLLYGLMLRSGNDAAIAISEHIGGSVEGFSYLMNEKAQWIGMQNSNFENPHGLESDNHYSTAYDIAMLLKYAMENDIFNEISGSKSYLSANRTYKWYNKNKLLTTYYEYCTGGKTGFTKRAGRTLATSAHKDGMDLIIVTLNAPNDWKDHIHMFEWGFENHDLKQLGKKGIEKYFINEPNQLIEGYITKDVFYPLSHQEQQLINEQIYILSSHKEQTKQIGSKVFTIESKPIVNVPIYSPQTKNSNNSWSIMILKEFKKIMGLKTSG